jgi:hypothetical protein
MRDAYLANVAWPLRPALARGPVFHPESRVAAGLSAEFVEMLAAAMKQGSSLGRRGS